MSGYGLWFSRFTASGEGWLPLVAFGSSAWVFVAAATAPDIGAASTPDAAEVSMVATVPVATPSTRTDEVAKASSNAPTHQSPSDARSTAVDAASSGFESSAQRPVSLTLR
jgi:hypothetical protein